MEKIELKVHKSKAHKMTSAEETIQLARIQQAASMSALYERKHNQKALKVVTVAAYILFVSMAAITLSFYYVFIWDPSTKPLPPRTTQNCDNKVIIPESLAIRLANSTEITAENFFKNIFRSYQALQNKDKKMIEMKKFPQSNSLENSNQSFNQSASSSIKNQTIIPTQTTKSSASFETTTMRSSTILPAITSMDLLKSNNNDILVEQPSSSASLSSSIGLNKNHQDDDEDTENDVDYESSGSDGSINWNDTTIQLDNDNNNRQ